MKKLLIITALACMISTPSLAKCKNDKVCLRWNYAWTYTWKGNKQVKHYYQFCVKWVKVRRCGPK